MRWPRLGQPPRRGLRAPDDLTNYRRVFQELSMWRTRVTLKKVPAYTLVKIGSVVYNSVTGRG